MRLIPKTVRASKQDWAKIKKNAKRNKMSVSAFLVGVGSGSFIGWSEENCVLCRNKH